MYSVITPCRVNENESAKTFILGPTRSCITNSRMTAQGSGIITHGLGNNLFFIPLAFLCFATLILIVREVPPFYDGTPSRASSSEYIFIRSTKEQGLYPHSRFDIDGFERIFGSLQ